jgi:hypothetical protein
MSLAHKGYLEVPPEVTFTPKPHDDGLIGEKNTIFVRPTTAAASYSGGESIRFRLAMGKTIDPASLCFFGTFKCSNDNFMFEDWAGTIVRTINIRFNDSVLVERIDQAHRLRNVLSVVSMSETYKRKNGEWEGWCPHPPLKQLYGSAAFGAFTQQQQEAPLYDNRTGAFLPIAPPPAVVTGADNTGVVTLNYLTGFNRGGNCRAYAWNYNPDGGAAFTAQAVKYQRERNATGTVYGFKLDLSGVLNCGKYLHLPAIGSLDIELVLNQGTDCLNGLVAASAAVSTDVVAMVTPTTANATYTITDPYLTCDTIEMSSAYLVALDKVINSGGLNLDFDTWQTWVNQLGVVNNSVQQIRIQRTFQSLKALFFWLYLDTDSTADPNNKLVTQNKSHKACKTSLTSYNVLVDGRPVNSHVITNDAEMAIELQKALKQHGDSSVDSLHSLANRRRGNAVTQLASQSLVVLDCADNAAMRAKDFPGALPQSLNSGPHACLMGVDFEKSNLLSGRRVNEIVIELTFSGSSYAPVTCYTVCHYDKRVVVAAGKTFVEID